MILKSLTLSLCSLSLLSCGQDWKVDTGSTNNIEEPVVEAAAPTSARAPRTRRRPVTPRPLKDNPFAVPEVTRELPGEKDLKPSVPSPSPIPVEPKEDTGPTVTSKPPAPPE